MYQPQLYPALVSPYGCNKSTCAAPSASYIYAHAGSSGTAESDRGCIVLHLHILDLVHASLVPVKKDYAPLATMDYSDPDAFTLPYQLTKQVRRDVYPLLEPTQPELSAKGKTVLITGVSGGIGKVSTISGGAQFSFGMTNRCRPSPNRGPPRELPAS